MGPERHNQDSDIVSMPAFTCGWIRQCLRGLFSQMQDVFMSLINSSAMRSTSRVLDLGEVRLRRARIDSLVRSLPQKVSCIAKVPYKKPKSLEA